MTVQLIIDGYNLLHVTGIVGRGVGPATLERSRGALLNFLATSLDAAERGQTAVVFDAKDAPPGLPRILNRHGLTVMFAPRFEEADTLIEELIVAHSAPRRLTVVSSDHRIQRAARRRRAAAIDSEQWYALIVGRRHERAGQAGPHDDEKPATPLSEADVKGWLAEFADVKMRELSEGGESPSKPGSDQATDGPLDESDDYNPFPRGYGEDAWGDT